MATSSAWLTGASYLALLSRFTSVGILATCTYLAVANALLAIGATSPGAASVAGYLAGMLISFFGQGRFTFLVRRHTARQAMRFVAASLCGLIISYSGMHLAVFNLGLPPFMGTILVAILVPLINLLLLKWWVFREVPE
jgi:putative flippase GtrA